MKLLCPFLFTNKQTFSNRKKKICTGNVEREKKRIKSELPDLNWGPIGFYDKYPLQPTALPAELSSGIYF
jgi:hypothetical protein